MTRRRRLKVRMSTVEPKKQKPHTPAKIVALHDSTPFFANNMTANIGAMPGAKYVGHCHAQFSRDSQICAAMKVVMVHTRRSEAKPRRIAHSSVCMNATHVAQKGNTPERKMYNEPRKVGMIGKGRGVLFTRQGTHVRGRNAKRDGTITPIMNTSQCSNETWEKNCGWGYH